MSPPPRAAATVAACCHCCPFLLQQPPPAAIAAALCRLRACMPPPPPGDCFVFRGQKRFETSIFAGKDRHSRDLRPSGTLKSSSPRKLCFTHVWPRCARCISNMGKTARVRKRVKKAYPAAKFYLRSWSGRTQNIVGDVQWCFFFEKTMRAAMALPQNMDTPRIVRTMTPLIGTVRGGTLSTERTMSYRKAQHKFECKDISPPSRGRDCGIEEDERSDGPLSWPSGPDLNIRLLVSIKIPGFDIVQDIVRAAQCPLRAALIGSP